MRVRNKICTGEGKWWLHEMKERVSIISPEEGGHNSFYNWKGEENCRGNTVLSWYRKFSYYSTGMVHEEMMHIHIQSISVALNIPFPIFTGNLWFAFAVNFYGTHYNHNSCVQSTECSNTTEINCSLVWLWGWPDYSITVTPFLHALSFSVDKQWKKRYVQERRKCTNLAELTRKAKNNQESLQVLWEKKKGFHERIRST